MPLLEQVLEKYPEQVKLVFKNFPLKNHKYARKAAAAALAAQNQGKFWEFSEELFKNTRQLSDEKVKQIVGQLGLDEERFQKDWQDPQIAEKLQKEVRQGTKIGVRGTPSIFVNGRLLRQRSMEGFRLIIEKELKKSGKEDA
jgi:protein-disulfide isomerase